MWYINEEHIVCAKKVINQFEISRLTRREDLKKCYILYMTNGKEIIIENMI